MLLYGIAGAIVLRALFIVAGAAALDTFPAMTYVLGALLAFTAVKIARHGGEQVDPDRTLAMRVLRRLVPLATTTTASGWSRGGRRQAARARRCSPPSSWSPPST